MSSMAQRRTAAAAAITMLFAVLQYVLLSVSSMPAFAATELGGTVENTFVNYQPNDGGWTPGQNPQYVEGDVIPLSFSVTGAVTSEQYEFTACFDYEAPNGAHAFRQIADIQTDYVVPPRGDAFTSSLGGAASDHATIDDVALLPFNDAVCGNNKEKLAYRITLTALASDFYVYFGGETATEGDTTAYGDSVTAGVAQWPTGTFQVYLEQTTGNKTVNFKPTDFLPPGAATISVSKTATSPSDAASSGVLSGTDVTYTVTVENDSSEAAVTIDSISDNVFGEIAPNKAAGVVSTTCSVVGPLVLVVSDGTPGSGPDFYSCTFVGTVSGSAGLSHDNTVTVSGTDENQNSVTDSDSESVPVLFSDVSVSVIPGECVYDGGSLTPVAVSIDPASGSTVTISGPGGPYATSSSTSFDLAPGSYTWSASAATNYQFTGTSSGSFTIADCAPGAISVDKDASVSSVTAPGGDVTYTVTVTNTSSPSQGVTITKIDDDQFGVIWDTATDSGMAAADTTCDTELGADGRYLAAATDSFSCTFVGSVTGNAGDTHTNIVTGSGVDDLDNPVSDTGTESVRVIADQVTVTIQPGSCYYDGGSFTPVTVTIDPDSGATVELKDGSTVVATFSGTGGSEDLAPGTYDVVVTTADNFELVGDVPETVTVGDCAPGAISVDKDASVSSVTAPGGDVTYTVTVTNTSSPSQGVTITKSTMTSLV